MNLGGIERRGERLDPAADASAVERPMDIYERFDVGKVACAMRHGLHDD